MSVLQLVNTANPRNVAKRLLRQKDPKITAHRVHIHAQPTKAFGSQWEFWLRSCGFNVNPHACRLSAQEVRFRAQALEQRGDS